MATTASRARPMATVYHSGARSCTCATYSSHAAHAIAGDAICSPTERRPTPAAPTWTATAATAGTSRVGSDPSPIATATRAAAAPSSMVARTHPRPHGRRVRTRVATASTAASAERAITWVADEAWATCSDITVAPRAAT